MSYNRQLISRSRSAIHSSYHSIALPLSISLFLLSLSSTFFLLCDIFLPSSTKSCCYSRCSEVVTFYSFVLELGRGNERERKKKRVTRKGREKVRIRRNQSQKSVLLFFFLGSLLGSEKENKDEIDLGEVIATEIHLSGFLSLPLFASLSFFPLFLFLLFLLFPYGKEGTKGWIVLTSLSIPSILLSKRETSREKRKSGERGFHGKEAGKF